MNARLQMLLDRIPDGAYTVDVGSDHALLPAALALRDPTAEIVATDIADGPLERARHTLAAAGLSGRVKTVKSDGLESLSLEGVTVTVIAGMGGELIRDIIAAAGERLHGTDLLLQPMTHADRLREYLCAEGYCIYDEDITPTGKPYQMLACRFDGCARSLSPAELKLGSVNIARRPVGLCAALKIALTAAERELTGRQKAGIDTSGVRRLIAELEAIRDRR